MKLLVAVSAFAAWACTATASAGDFRDDLYFQRNEPGKLEENIKGLEAALTAQGDPAPYLWRLCRAKMRRGETLKTRAEKLAAFDSAKTDCEKSVALSSGVVDAHFWLGVSLGRWAETKGMMKALFTLKTIKREMAETLKLDPNHGGAHNVLGEIWWQVPGFAGGDKKKALAEFETALRLSPRYTANHQPLAEAYVHFGRKEDAIRVLKQVEAMKDPADPAEYPDNLADAKKLLEKLGAQ